MYGSRLQSSGSVFWSGSELDCDQEEIGKKRKRARSKPSEVEHCCLTHAQYCGCLRCLPSTVFSFPVYLIGCCLSAGHIHLTDWQFWCWLPPRNGAVMQTFFWESGSLIFSKSHSWYPFCEDGQAKHIVYLIHLNAPGQNVHGIFPGVGLLCLWFNVYVCVQLSIHDRHFFPSIWPSSTAPYIDLDPVHLDIPPPCLHAYTYIYPPLLSPSSPSSSRALCPSFLAFLQSRNRSSGNGRLIADSPPASASLGRCLFASHHIVILSIWPVPPYLQ